MKDFKEKKLKDKYKKYRFVKLPTTKTKDFIDAKIDLIKDKINKILEVESPIERIYLYNKIVSSFGTSKFGKRSEEVLDSILKEMDVFKDGETISAEKIPEICEVRLSDERDRKFIFIPKEELAGAILDVLENTPSSTTEAIVKDVAKEIFGCRITNKVTAKISEAIDYLVLKGKIKEKDGKIN